MSTTPNNEHQYRLPYTTRAGVKQFQKNWDDWKTTTTYDQRECEEACAKYLIPVEKLSKEEREEMEFSGLINADGEFQFLRSKHINYLNSISGYLGPKYAGHASSRPWLCYHVLNSLDLLGEEPRIDREGALQSLDSCRTIYGGYAGSEYEFPHTMTTYAAINSLISLEAYDHIDRRSLYEFFLSQKQANGSFSVHTNGYVVILSGERGMGLINSESDCRSTYCVLSICHLLHMLTPEITSGVKEFLLSCQTYEGGFGSCPCTEAHGGYTFCSIAALRILNALHECNLSSLERWLYSRQCELEGGFNGRTNKLVDGCYSWYVGSSIRMMHELRDPTSMPLWNLDKLMQYAFHMEQHPNGGLRDKPEMRSDPYHTMYCLCGLSAAGGGGVLPVGNNEIDCIHCVEKTKVEKCMEHFSVYQEEHASILNELPPMVIECESSDNLYVCLLRKCFAEQTIRK